MRALLLTGTGRYADPWHPFEHTSDQVARLLRSAGFDVQEEVDVDRGLASLLDDRETSMVVVNAGDPWRNGHDEVRVDDGAERGLRAALDRGVGVIGLHAAAASLRDLPSWAGALGAIWLPGVSFHPPLSSTVVRVAPSAHFVTDGVTDFEVIDERYCRLQGTGQVDVLATHAGDSHPEPAVWARSVGRSRVVYDALGHDERSYESLEHRAILVNAARWVAHVEAR